MIVAAAAVVLAAAAPLPSVAAPPAQPGSPIALGRPRSFAGAVAALERATGARAEPLVTQGGEVPRGEGSSFPVESRTAERILAGSHAAFREAGLYLFRLERGFGMEKDRLALLATADRAAVLRRVGTAGARQGVGTERVIAWLDELARTEPFDLTEIGADYVAGRFVRTPKDAAGIARRSAELAPDLVAGRASTLALLAEEIRANRTLYLIW